MGTGQGMIGFCCRHVCRYLLVLQLTDKLDRVAAPELACGDATPGRDNRASCKLGAGFDERTFGDDTADPDEGFVLNGC